MPVLRLPARAWPADAAEHLGTLVSATVHLLPQALGDRWCANRTGAAAEWLAAMDAGGTAAQVALAAMYFYTCREGDQAALWDWLADELINGEALNSPATALKYARAMVAAADADGINFCVRSGLQLRSSARAKGCLASPQGGEAGGCVSADACAIACATGGRHYVMIT